MSEADALRDLLHDGFGRVRELVEQLSDRIDESTAGFQVDPGANPPSWLVWHLARVQDDHVAGLAGVPQAWDTWAERFGLPFDHDDIGYGQDIDAVLQVCATGDLLAAYHRDVDALTRRYLDTVTSDELARVVDERWDPPVTAGVRLVSVLGDTLQHLGQVAYVLGVADRRTPRG